MFSLLAVSQPAPVRFHASPTRKLQMDWNMLRHINALGE